MQGFNYKKAVQMLNYFASQSPDTPFNKMKAIKMIWLADRLHLYQHGKMMTNDVYFAMKLGPVPSTTKDILNNYDLSEDESAYAQQFLKTSEQYNYTSIKEVDTKIFSKNNLNVLEIIWNKYQHLDRTQLSDLSHKFPEWAKYEIPIVNKMASRYEIDVRDFFKNIDDGNGLFVDSEDTVNITKDIFLENLQISNILQCTSII